ncbi:HlyD family type I secretion periplasmic adaptor subunit [Massilia sp. CF038]|uniref:HlyD family type I secretion periplasmic adaptor subunit n=1 Tax=Massilia sp. CF038 TaxID=1881045 RepID=UPI0009128EEC|nr:HlyD family type I secretion periplasmic adaptor subunit [Massilia sp. CF038]SHH06595.1 membrane fusion protein, adhesin transport system [Massilia sp. CF038]
MQKLKKFWFASLRLLEAIRVRVDKGTAHWLTRWKDSTTLTETDFMQDADSIIIRQEPLRARVLGYALTGSVVLFLIWAAIVDVDEITRGDAKVIPSRQLQVLQSLDGGIVSKIEVQEGDTVAEGQVLLQVDSTRFESSVRENRSQYLSLLAKAARLRAIGEEKPFVPPPEALAEDPRTVEEERRLYETATSELNAQLQIARQQLNQRSQELNEASAKQRQAAQAFESTSRELAVTKPLLSSGAVSEVELLRLERDVARFRGERDIAASQIARVQSAISESSRKIQEVELSFRNTASKEYSETMAKLNSLVQSGTGLADRVKQSSLRSPVKGTIKRLLVNTVGGVVQPGRDVVEIVPLEGRLLLEAKVAPRDIAFLKPGQRAIVKFTAYDFSIYGGLTASVEHIGADSVTDERGNTFYTVRVATDKTSLSGNLPIIPGMVAEVDIITGKKTILSYLLKPVLRAKASALTER